MKYKKYPSYKDSGVEWLGEIPSEWKITKVKHLFNLGRGRVISQEELVDNAEYPVYSSQTKDNGVLGYINTYDFDCNQITWTTDGANAGTVFLREGKHNCTNVCGTLQPRNRSENLEYFTNTLQYATTFYKRPDTNGAKIMNGEMSEIFLTFPPLQEQQQIAKFLDNATQKMDTLIKNQERLIELLKEKRQAVISHAVTRGLNPDVKFKDSGVEWLGDVPEHWESSLLKYHTVKVTDGAHISPELENGKHYFLSVKDITTGKILFDDALLTSEESYRYMIKTGCKPEIGDILFGKDGTIGVTSIVETEIPFVVSSSVIIIRTDTNQFSKFINYCCISNFFQEQVNSFVKGAGLKRLSIQNLLKIYSTFPPFVEQQKIANYLDDKTKRIDTLIEKSKKSIKLLKEKRTALISSAVTGKIDVRELVS